jgi:hypothetical protein
MQTFHQILYHALRLGPARRGLLVHSEDASVISCIASALSHISEVNNAVYAPIREVLDTEVTGNLTAFEIFECLAHIAPQPLADKVPSLMRLTAVCDPANSVWMAISSRRRSRTRSANGSHTSWKSSIPTPFVARFLSFAMPI